MALQGTAKEARAKRKEQLRLWEESETNQVAVGSRAAKSPRVKFNEECMFLAACAAGDKDEVDRLLTTSNANINTVNVDGLTALHQACIDNNLEMAEFLIERGIDINRGDNEGWTPLHATASCGYVSIAQLLIEKGARLDVVNVDNELAVDRAEEPEMKALLQNEASKRGIDADHVRQQEQKQMLDDVKKALNAARGKSSESQPLIVDTRTGATALHVAAAKGYTEVVYVILKEAFLKSSSLDRVVHYQDFDGWTPLHAAAHWAQKEACEMLVKEGLADLDKVTHSGQSVADVCDESLTDYLEDLRAKRPAWIEERQKMLLEHREIESPPHEVVTLSLKPMPAAFKRRSSVTRMSVGDKSHLKDLSAERISEYNTVAAATLLRDTACILEEEPSIEATIELTAPPPPLPRSEPPLFDASSPSTPSSVSFLNSTNAGNSGVDSNSSNSSPSNTSVSTAATLNLGNGSSSQNNWVAGIKRSFAAPVRDEESETQRKAHAKRVRETRRSTQGVTLEDIKSAEEHLKGSKDAQKPKSSGADSPTTAHASLTIPATTTSLSSMELGSDSSLERRTSWRERAAAEQRQRQIEDAPHLKIVDSIEAVHHVANSTTGDSTNNNDTSLSQSTTQSLAAGVTTPDTEDDSSTPPTAATNRTRRRAKRRSTGVCSQSAAGAHQDGAVPDATTNLVEQLEADNAQSRVAISTIQFRNQSTETHNAESAGSTSDFKKMYEQEQKLRSSLQKELESARKETDHLRELLAEKEELVLEVKKKLEHERSRRLEAEKNLRDVQNDIRNVDTLKKKIDLMQEENAALIRVISKLSINTSHSTK